MVLDNKYPGSSIKSIYIKRAYQQDQSHRIWLTDPAAIFFISIISSGI
jgi:hypothetical protein